MIKDAPIITMRRNFTRPPAKVVAAFAGVPTGHVIDALGGRGGVDYRIKPLAPLTEVMVGVALTCHAGPADNLALIAALDAARPGDVIMACCDAYHGTALTGDMVMGMARNRGVKGLVTDGLVRDVVGILGVGLPCYCMGVTPNSPDRNGPAKVGLPIVLGGVAVESGDIVIGDGDGVVVVPRARAAQVLKNLEDVRAGEAALEAKVKGGLQVPDFVKSILDSDRTVEVT